MSPAIDVTYVVVNYKTSELLPRHLAAAQHAAGALQVEWIIVENGGDQEAVSQACAELTGVRVVVSPKNIGFGAAANLGAREGCGRYVMICNPDSFLEEQGLLPLVAALESSPDVALVGPRIFDEDGAIQESARRFPSFLTGLFGRSNLLTRLFPGNPISQRELLASRLADTPVAPVDWVSGAAFLVRRESFEAIGGFDEGYFLYWEDADLCRRLTEAGGTIGYVKAAEVTHLCGRSMASAKVLSTVEFHKSAYRYYVTHNVPWAPFFLRWVLALGLGARAALKVFSGWLRGVLGR